MPVGATSGAEIARLRRAAEAVGTGQPLSELTMAVVGARFDNKRRKGKPTGNRRTEIMMAEPGAPLLLQPEPTNPADRNAIAVYATSGVQIGYISADKTPILHAAWVAAREVIAIFQEATAWGGFIRVGLDQQPTLPSGRAADRSERRPVVARDDWNAVDDIPPDE